MTSIDALVTGQNGYLQSNLSNESVEATKPAVVQNSTLRKELQPLVGTPSQSGSLLTEQEANSLARIVEVCVSLAVAVVNLVTAFLPSKHKGELPVGGPPKNPPVGLDSARPSKTNTTGVTTKPGLQAIQDEKGQVVVRTPDGFVVRALASHQARTITGPEGKTTRIFGDPHVFESDGTRWDFTKQGTFVFGRNKATVEVVPAGNGTTLSRRVTIYSGDQRATIGGIDGNKPTLLALAHDGRPHDDALSDGSIYVRHVTAGGESWSRRTTGRSIVMGK